MDNQSEHHFLSLLLPQGILEYFILTRYTNSGQDICLYLDEKNDIPEEYQNDKLTSKGFFDEITVQDFPLRGKAVFRETSNYLCWLVSAPTMPSADFFTI